MSFFNSIFLLISSISDLLGATSSKMKTITGPRTLRCMMCGLTIRTKILANHLENKHNIARDNVKKFCDIQFQNEDRVLKQNIIQNATVKKDKKTVKSEKRKLKKRFQDSLRDQYLNLDVFTKMLMDVSFEYHEKRLDSPGEPSVRREESFLSKEPNQVNKQSEEKSDLKLRINLKEKKVIQNNTNKSVKEIYHLHQCKACKETFKSESFLKKHFNKQHNNNLRKNQPKKIKEVIKNHPIQKLRQNKRTKA